MQKPLTSMHEALGATLCAEGRPLHYGAGAEAEHSHTRAAASLFDISHLGQVQIRHAAGFVGAARALERLVPVDVLGLGEKRLRYGVVTNAQGGIDDDVTITRRGDTLFVVGSVARWQQDLARAVPEGEVVAVTDRAFLAVQGPRAVEAMAPVAAGCEIMAFRDAGIFASEFGELWVSRSGYTGEDGYEVSVPVEHAVALARAVLEHGAVRPAGLEARESLRREAGLCRYGQDIDATTTPVEAGLARVIGEARRAGGARAGGFPGAEVILDQLENGVARCRVGLRPGDGVPVPDGATLHAAQDNAASVGRVTSGSVGVACAMGYVAAHHAFAGTQLWAEGAGGRLAVIVEDLPGFGAKNRERA